MISHYKRIGSWLFGFVSPVFLSLSLLLPSSSYSWNATGHMVVAAIAYEQLNPGVKEKVDKIVSYMHQEYSDMNTMMDLAYWPDTLHGQHIELYSHWHYINLPYTTDDTPPKYSIDTDNAVWAIKRIRNVVKNDHANPYERARFLSFLVHITGDLHQPLHSVSLYSKKHPSGDRGGNSYKIKYNGKVIKLHTLWDGGVTAFDFRGHSDDRSMEIARNIMALYPETSFTKKMRQDVDPDHWAQEGLELAKKTVYKVREDEVPTTSYVQRSTKAAEKQVALAGYRLGNLLNSLLS